MITLKSLDALVACPYCEHIAELVTGFDIYGKSRPDLHGKKFWLCRGCNAYVGCHDGTTTPFGTLANAELRTARMRAHAVFDALWVNERFRGTMRTKAYAWLAVKMGIKFEDCHIGLFSVTQCKLVCDLCAKGMDK